MKRTLVKNIVVGFGGQIVVLVLGIIVPRVLITNYGSDVNGLISTVTQIFSYMALLEAGIGQAARNALYKPISEKNQNGFSYVVSVAQRYFRRITVYYGLGVVLLAVLAPITLKSQVDNRTISLVILLQGLSGVITFYFIQVQTVILNVDGRAYVNNGINLLNQVLSYSVRIVLASLGVDIVLLQLAYFLISVGKVLIYKWYFTNKYSWIDYRVAPKTAVLPERNAYILSELAWTLFSSTDMIVLSTFVSTELSSVYTIYNLVFNNLNILLNAIYSSISYILGQTFHEDKAKYVLLHDVFTSVFLGGMTVLMCITYILVLPFVNLYTQGVTDVEYIYPSLPVLFCLVQILSWSRYITGNLTAIAGYAKYTSRISLVEAMTNVILSVALVHKFGIVGVLLATVFALPLKVIYCIYLSDTKILKRSSRKTLSILGINYFLFTVTVWVSRKMVLPIENYLDFLKYGIIVTVIFVSIGVILNVMINSDCVTVIKSVCTKK